ncbi:MAG: TfoX/Sxy family protein, partial [Burkholderiales bacterium]|nr:TfoX/Sxy family protein [Burkholderiales bacterium]
MAKRNEYIEHLLDQLAPLGLLRAKAMFGGYGFYCDEIFFA